MAWRGGGGGGPARGARPTGPGHPRRRRPSGGRRYLLWGVLGAAALVLVPVVVVGGAVLLLMPGMAFGEPPVPDGRPLVLPSGAFTGTWRDEDGGRLVLRADGTFASDGTCGDFSGPGLTDALSPAPGAGTWSASGTNADVPVTRVQVEFAPGGVWTVYEARGTAERPVLWQYLGDPDDGALCVLSRAGT